jgi:serine/threonine protein kinase
MERPHPVKDLFDYMLVGGSLPESLAREFFHQIVTTLIEVNKAGVIHRDLKTENLLVDLKTMEVKLIDFGSGALIKDGFYTDNNGTLEYIPPEWMRWHRYKGMDLTVWSLGIVLYVMVCTDVPFENREEILKAKLIFEGELSHGVKDLIRQLLSVNPSKRPSLSEILEHPWMQGSTYVEGYIDTDG